MCVLGKVFKKSVQLLMSPFTVILQIFYSNSAQRDIGHSKSTSWTLGGHLCTRALQRHFDTQTLKALGHLGTQDTRALKGHLGTRALRHLDSRRALGHSSSQALRYLGIQNTPATLFSRLKM